MGNKSLAGADEMSPRKINSIDVLVGQRLKLRRVSLGIRQDELSKLIGISFQQLQKYENGQNRISAGRLFDVAKALQVSVGWFFEGSVSMPVQDVERADANDRAVVDGCCTSDNFSAEELIEVVQIYCSIRRPETRKRFMRTVRFIANELNED